MTGALPCHHHHCAFKDFWRPDCSWDTTWAYAIVSSFSAVVSFFSLDGGRSPQTHYNLWQLLETSRCSTATTGLAWKPQTWNTRWATALHLSREWTTEESSQEGHDNNHAYELMQQQAGLADNISFLYPPSPLVLLLWWFEASQVSWNYSFEGGTFGASWHKMEGDAAGSLARGVLGNRTSLQGSGATGGKVKRVEGSHGPCWVMWLLFLRTGSS